MCTRLREKHGSRRGKRYLGPVMLFSRCCILGVMRQQFGAAFNQLSIAPQLCRCYALRRCLASRLSQASHVSEWIKFLRYTSPTRCTLHRQSNYNRTHRLPGMLIIQMSCNCACHADRDVGTHAAYEVVESKTAVNIRKLVF